MRILIAEDDNISRQLLKATLTKWGYEVIPTKNGREAWEQLQLDDSPQLAILDWMMPEMSGVEVCQKLREHEKSDYLTYVILLTALERKEDIVTGLQAGANDYVTKPFNASELRARVEVGERMIDLQNRLSDHVRRLKELDQLKTSFLSTVSHELRTPIAIMREGISLCLDGIAGELNETQSELLGDVLDNSDRLLRLITDLLDISKIEAGKIKLRRHVTDICQVIQKTVRMSELHANEKQIHLHTELPEMPLEMYVDSDKITQIISNLLNNSIRFTPENGDIYVRLVEKENFIECSVRDTGVGIAEENIPKLFSKFEQFGREEGPGYKGTGLGLAIVKGLIEKHGGEVWAESELGSGTTISFTVRKTLKPTILVVDDEERMRDVVKAFLKKDQYDFIDAGDGKTAIELALNHDFALIILDMQLPKMSGYEVIGRLKQDKRTEDIPILIMSGYVVDEERLSTFGEHAVFPILEKPFTSEQLIEHVGHILD